MTAVAAPAAALVVLVWCLDASAPPQAPAGLDAHLAAMKMRLTDEEPYRFVLRYRGPRVPFRGPLCYHFAGYNETCLDPRTEWLTPATEIELHAPGGVPRDLLAGYTMLVRYPALSERTFRYDLARD